MNSLALAIHTFPGGSQALKRHWNHFQKAGAQEIIAITTTDGGCEVPEGCREEMIGANIYIQSSHLPMRLLRTLQFLKETKHDWFAVAEYDVLFLREIPRDLPEGFTTHLAGGKPEGCHCNFFVHPPWICDRETAEVFVQAGYEVLASKNFDCSPDCFAGQVLERANIPVHTGILKSYSRNTIHGDMWVQEARAAIESGAVCVHGVKDPEVFNALTR